MGDAPINSFVLIIGAMKAGTTSLFHYLKQHPQIAASSVKEPEFFVSDADPTKTADYYRLWAWRPGVHRWALEASVAYTSHKRGPAIARRIAAFSADFRFVYVIRDPIERIESQYNHAYSAGWIKRDVGIDELIEKRFHFIKSSSYASQLDPYRDLFGREKILLVNTTDMATSPVTEMQRVVKFLRLDPFPFKDLASVHNPGQGRIVEHAMIARVRGHRRLFEGLRRYVPANAQRYVREALGQRLREPFKMSPSTRKRVLEILQDDLQRLAREWDVDISKWHLEADGSAPGTDPVLTGGGSRGAV